MSGERRALMRRHAEEGRALAAVLACDCRHKLQAARSLLATLAAYVEELLSEDRL